MLGRAMIRAITSQHERNRDKWLVQHRAHGEERGPGLGGNGWMDGDGIRRLYRLVQEAKVCPMIARNVASFGLGRPLLIRAETGVWTCTSPYTSPCTSPCRESMCIYMRKKVRKRYGVADGRLRPYPTSAERGLRPPHGAAGSVLGRIGGWAIPALRLAGRPHI